MMLLFLFIDIYNINARPNLPDCLNAEHFYWMYRRIEKLLLTRQILGRILNSINVCVYVCVCVCVCVHAVQDKLNNKTA